MRVGFQSNVDLRVADSVEAVENEPPRGWLCTLGLTNFENFGAIVDG